MVAPVKTNMTFESDSYDRNSQTIRNLREKALFSNWEKVFFSNFIFNGEEKPIKPEYFTFLPENTIVIQFLPNTYNFVLKKCNAKEVVSVHASEGDLKAIYESFYEQENVRKFLSTKFEVKNPLSVKFKVETLPLLSEDSFTSHQLQFLVKKCLKNRKTHQYYIRELQVLGQLIEESTDTQKKTKALQIVADGSSECPAGWFNDVIRAQKLLLGTSELSSFIHYLKEELADLLVDQMVSEDLVACRDKNVLDSRGFATETSHAEIHLKQILYQQKIYVSHADLLLFKDVTKNQKSFGVHGDPKKITEQFLLRFSGQFVTVLRERLLKESSNNNTELMSQVKTVFQKTHKDEAQESEWLASYDENGMFTDITPLGILQLLENLSL